MILISNLTIMFDFVLQLQATSL